MKHPNIVEPSGVKRALAECSQVEQRYIPLKRRLVELSEVMRS